MRGFEVKLKSKEVKELKLMLRKGSEKARKLTRCRILLLCHEGKPKALISSLLCINPNTVSNSCRRYVEEGLDSALNERPRPGAPQRFDGRIKAKITALACSKPPEGHSQWSLRLLSDRVVELAFVDSISHTDVGRILKKTK